LFLSPFKLTFKKKTAQETEKYSVKKAALDMNGKETFLLYGYKWFSSTTDSDMTITLARMDKKNDGENVIFV
jgi:alkylation response protein AidB-like acyl-CoA dehydrogenase